MIPTRKHLTVPAVALLAVLFLAPFAAADTIVLKDGTSVEGKVLVETDTEVVIEVQVSDSITDRKSYPKADVAEVRKASPDDIAWAELADFRLPATSLDAGDYDMLAGQFEDFLAKFPTSTHAGDATRLLGEVRAEQKRVQAGDLKLDGKWISADEVLRRGSEITAVKALMRMKSLAAGGDLPGALNEYKSIEKNFKNEAAYPEAVELSRQIIAALQAELIRRRAELDRYKAEFESSLALTPDHQKQGIMDAAKARQLEYDAILARAQQAGLEFPPLIPRSENSLKQLENAVKREASKLARLDVSSMQAAARLVQRAEEAIAAGRMAEVDPLLEQAKKLWSQYAAIPRIQAVAEAAKVTAEAEAAAREAERIAKEAEAKAAQAAEAAASQAAEQPTEAQATEKSATASTEKPFYLTVPGAIGIVVALVVLLGIVTAVSKLSSRKKEE